MVSRALAAAALFVLAPVALTSTTAAGQLDAAFSGDGWLYSRQFFGYSDQRPDPRGVQDLAVQADGRTIVVGALDWNGRRHFGAYRFTADGNLDRSFASGGWVVTDVGDDTGEAHTVAVQRDGKIVLGGTTICPQHRTCIVLVRYLPSGALDSSFGDGGIARTVRPHYGSRAMRRSTSRSSRMGESWLSCETASRSSSSRDTYPTDGSTAASPATASPRSA